MEFWIWEAVESEAELVAKSAAEKATKQDAPLEEQDVEELRNLMSKNDCQRKGLFCLDISFQVVVRFTTASVNRKSIVSSLNSPPLPR